MTNEELEQEIRDVSESIESLAEPEKPLSKEEKRHRDVLLLKKEILDNIKDAREKNDKSGEIRNLMTYGLLTSWGEKHPYLMSIVQSNMRWGAF